MGTTPFQRENHYVPCVYLKRFSAPYGRVETYRLLVSHPNASLWKKQSPRAIAYHSHLYTRMTAAGPSDEFEKWLERDFETPAEGPLRKATSDEQLSADDWKHLVRFAAAQTVRTPARLYEHIQRWEKRMPEFLDDVFRKSIERLKRAKETGEEFPPVSPEYRDLIPVRVTTELKEGRPHGTLRSEIVLGRGTWLFSIKHLLTRTLAVLHQHRWTVLKAPDGLNWFTSDDPVIRLNFYGGDKYDFRGGWGNPGSEILLPLSPRHVLYTKVGERPAQRGTVVSRQEAEMIRRCIAEHAHRMIFAVSPVDDLPELRPRVIDDELVRTEREQWRKWHDEQVAAERALMDKEP